MNHWKVNLFREVKFRAEKSQGPGGQNVNKVSTAALLTWQPLESELFSPEDLQKILKGLSVDKAGQVRIRSQKFRELPANKRACMEKLISRIEVALQPVKPRKKTKPTRNSKVKAERTKRMRSEVKKLRAKVRV